SNLSTKGVVEVHALALRDTKKRVYPRNPESSHGSGQSPRVVALACPVHKIFADGRSRQARNRKLEPSRPHGELRGRARRSSWVRRLPRKGVQEPKRKWRFKWKRRWEGLRRWRLVCSRRTRPRWKSTRSSSGPRRRSYNVERTSGKQLRPVQPVPPR